MIERIRVREWKTILLLLEIFDETLRTNLSGLKFINLLPLGAQRHK